MRRSFAIALLAVLPRSGRLVELADGEEAVERLDERLLFVLGLGQRLRQRIAQHEAIIVADEMEHVAGIDRL